MSKYPMEEVPDLFPNFEAIQEDLNYYQAQQTLQNLVKNLDLRAREKAELTSEINHLCELLEKLDQARLQIAVFGLVGRGKSSILNALLGQTIFATGPLHGVTQDIHATGWQLPASDELPDLQGYTLQGWGNAQIQLIDTPGIDEVDGHHRELLAKAVAQKADLILFVIAGDMSKVEYQALSELRQVGKPMILVFNKIDQYPARDRTLIYEKIRDERVKELLSPSEIVLVSAHPLKTEWLKDDQGKTRRRQYRGEPDIQELHLKIVEILQREGKSLMALNVLLCADTANDRIIQQKLQLREYWANQLIEKAVLLKAGAIALNPVTLLDLLTGAVIDVAMILSLSRLYGLPMTQPAAIALLQKIGVSMGGLSASDFLATLGLSSLKGLLGLTVPVTGGMSLAPYLSIALTQAGVAGVTCYAIGQVTKTYLAQGASWGETGPKTVVTEILARLDEASILNRIQTELRAKLTATPLDR